MWADRLPRVRVLVGADLLRLVAVLALAVTAGIRPSVPLLAALVLLVGAGEAFFRPAAGALLPSVLAEEHLAAGNALSSFTQQLAQVVGPGAAGLLVVAGGVRVGFLLAALAFAVSAATVLQVREPPYDPPVHAPVLREAAAGLAAVRDRPWIASCLVVFSLFMLLVAAPVHVLLPVVVRESTGQTASYGVVLSVGAVGGVAGALLATRLRTAARGRVALLSVVLLALEPLALLLELPLAGLAACWVASSAGLGLFIVVWESALQADVPRELLARVVSLDWMASYALFPVGLALTGPRSSWWGAVRCCSSRSSSRWSRLSRSWPCRVRRRSAPLLPPLPVNGPVRRRGARRRPAEAQVRARRGRAALPLVARAVPLGAVRVLSGRAERQHAHLPDLHARVEPDRQVGHVAQLQRHVTGEAGVDEAGGGVREEAEATQ